MTSIRSTSQDQTVVTLPKALRESIEIESGAGIRARVSIRCKPDTEDSLPAFELVIGPDVEGPGTVAPRIGTRQTEIIIPSFLAAVWELAGARLQWPSPDEITVGGGSTTITAAIEDWDWPVTVADDSISREPVATAAVSPDPTRTHLPAAIRDGLPESDRLAFSMTCVDSTRVIVATPTDQSGTNTVMLMPSGPGGSQVQFSTAELMNALGVREAAVDRRVSLAWRLIDGGQSALATVEVADRD